MLLLLEMGIQLIIINASDLYKIDFESVKYMYM